MWVTITPCTSATSQPTSLRPLCSAEKASSVFHPASMRYGPRSVSNTYTSTYRSELFGSGTGTLHSPGRTFSTPGNGSLAAAAPRARWACGGAGAWPCPEPEVEVTADERRSCRRGRTQPPGRTDLPCDVIGLGLDPIDQSPFLRRRHVDRRRGEGQGRGAQAPDPAGQADRAASAGDEPKPDLGQGKRG